MRGLPGGARSRCLCAFSIMTMAASTMAPMAIAMPPRLMMLEPRPSAFMAANAISTPTGSMRIATSALRTCSRKTTQTSATMTLSSSSVCCKVSIAAWISCRAVVDRHDLDALGQARRHFGKPRLDVVDHVERVGAEALQHDAARDLALAVELGDAAPFVGAELDARHVLQEDRRAAVVLQHDLLQIGDALQIAAAAHDEFEFGQLDGAAADVHVAGADGVAHLGQAGCRELRRRLRIDHDVVLLDEAADAGDFGDAFRLGEAVADRTSPAASAVRPAISSLAMQRILVDPADAGGIGAEGRASRRPADCAPRR